MTQRPRLSQEMEELSRALLLKQDADLSSGPSTAAAVAELLRALHGRLVVLIGEAGFVSLLELARVHALPEHPVLEGVTVPGSLEEFLSLDRLGSVKDGDGELADGLQAFLARLLFLLSVLGRDQDWTVVDLWPGLRAMKEAGLSLEPGAVED